MKSIDFLEHGGGEGEPFRLRHNGTLVDLPDPREMHYQEVLLALHEGHVPGTPGDLREWKRALVFDRWRAAWDLPLFNDARRLAYLVDHYRAPVSHDLMVYAQQDLGDLWRRRRWTLLLDIIDRLPSHSWYASSVSMDEDHAKMMAESITERRDSGEDQQSSGPSLVGWTPEVAAITNVLDAVRAVQHAVVAVQAPRDKQPEAPKPAPRPKTPLEKALKAAEFARRKAAHESLVARVLPKKSPPEDPVH